MGGAPRSPFPLDFFSDRKLLPNGTNFWTLPYVEAGVEHWQRGHFVFCSDMLITDTLREFLVTDEDCFEDELLAKIFKTLSLGECTLLCHFCKFFFLWSLKVHKMVLFVDIGMLV